MFFVGALSAEVVIIMSSYFITGRVIETSFFFLTGMTALAAVLFLHEGVPCTERSSLNAISSCLKARRLCAF